MIIFSTEFPVSPVRDRSAFLAQVISWLRGTKYSKVLDDPGDTELTGDAVHLHAANGEELLLREYCPNEVLEAIGFRHDYPDDEGRLWRTEAVLRRAAGAGGQDLIRLRTHCVALKTAAQLSTPRKPYLIKALIQDHWGGKDAEFEVSDKPHWLQDGSDDAVQLAYSATIGDASFCLPVVYISAIRAQRWVLSQDQIRKLAFDLGGIAHVVVEPSRVFSIHLRGLSSGKNAYGGTIGIILPSQGIVRRLFKNLRYQTSEDVAAGVRDAAMSIRSQMPAEGWDWTELQEQALRRQREKERSRLSFDDTEALYQEEIKNLQDRLRQLEQQLAAQSSDYRTRSDDDVLPDYLIQKIGPEVYSGEFSDRLRLAAKHCCLRAEQIGLDSRSVHVLTKLVEQLPLSAGLAELKEDLKRATKDPKRIATEVIEVMRQHGYREKADNKHIRLEALEGYTGLESITLSKTPSDHRGLINQRKQIERTLGLNILDV